MLVIESCLEYISNSTSHSFYTVTVHKIIAWIYILLHFLALSSNDLSFYCLICPFSRWRKTFWHLETNAGTNRKNSIFLLRKLCFLDVKLHFPCIEKSIFYWNHTQKISTIQSYARFYLHIIKPVADYWKEDISGIKMIIMNKRRKCGRSWIGRD